jgi:uncharacterized protein
MHNRLSPKQHRFHYNIFMFCLDLDTLESDIKNTSWLSRNRFNLFSFYDKDHLQLNENNSTNVRSQLNAYLNNNGIDTPPARVVLITSLRLLGYVFNPVSFYYCYDKNDQPICAVAEVQNTFREMKLFFVAKENFDGKQFRKRVVKHFYVSPFIDHDAEFDFQLDLPGDKMNIRIDDYKEDKRFFISTLTGTRKELTGTRLFFYALRFPFVTLQIITLIHWNAFLLWLKKIRYFKKKEFPELQRDVMNKYED